MSAASICHRSVLPTVLSFAGAGRYARCNACFCRRFAASVQPIPHPGHRVAVRRGLRVGRQHACHRSLAGAARRHFRRHGGPGLGRGDRLPVRQRRVRPGARPVWRSLRQDGRGGHRLHCRRSLLPLERTRDLAGAAHPGALPDRRRELGDHSARHRLGGRQCRLRAPPGHARPFPERPDARPDDGRGAGRRDRRLAGLALGVLGAGRHLHRSRQRAF